MDFKIKPTTSTVVRQTMTLELIDAAGGATPLETELSYDARDPFAVSATFNTIAGQVRWTFGRDLLINGVDEPTGDGDVHVFPCLDDHARPIIIIELCSPDGEALVQARPRDIHSFVAKMTAVVAPGAENQHVDVDAAIAAIFAAA